MLCLHGPVHLQKIQSDSFKGGVIELSAKVSSQYVSSVLISAPYAQKV